jgi:2-dehydro-3-deoxyphosphogluconate aldolase/(4S)-4-hydroxy-2-oxoglutarate aldolase
LIALAWCRILPHVETGKEPAAFTALRERRLVAAIRAASPDAAEQAALAIAKGGIRHIEITFTVPEALRVMKSLAGDSSMIVGAGTVLTAEQARAALDAGAQFLIAPNLSPAVAAVAREAGVLYCPGAYTTTEILAARDAGAHVVKVYPVGVAGGPPYIRVIRDPIPDVPLLAAGGTSLENMVPFLMAGCFGLGLGAALCDPALVAAGNARELTSRSRAFVQRLEQAYASGMVAPAGA